MGPTYPEKYPQAWHGPAQSGQVHLQPVPQHKQRHWDGRPPGLGAARHAETQHALVHDVQDCAYRGGRPLDRVADHI